MTHEDFMRVRDELAAVLAAEHASRPARGFNLDAELKAMHIAVNRHRLERRLPIVGIAAIDMADQMATGADYASKFALYCAELAVGMEGK